MASSSNQCEVSREHVGANHSRNTLNKAMVEESEYVSIVANDCGAHAAAGRRLASRRGDLGWPTDSPVLSRRLPQLSPLATVWQIGSLLFSSTCQLRPRLASGPPIPYPVAAASAASTSCHCLANRLTPSFIHLPTSSKTRFRLKASKFARSDCNTLTITLRRRAPFAVLLVRPALRSIAGDRNSRSMQLLVASTSAQIREKV